MEFEKNCGWSVFFNVMAILSIVLGVFFIGCWCYGLVTFSVLGIKMVVYESLIYCIYSWLFYSFLSWVSKKLNFLVEIGKENIYFDRKNRNKNG
mgnify:CR=1 FL=1